MKHDNKMILSLLVVILLFTGFCNCNQEDPQPICDYTAQGMQNYVWDIQIQGESLRDNTVDFSFPYTTAVPGLLQDDLNNWLQSGTATISIDTGRNYIVTIEATEITFVNLILSGDNSGGNQDVIEFEDNC